MKREWDDAILFVGLLLLSVSSMTFVGLLMWAWFN